MSIKKIMCMILCFIILIIGIQSVFANDTANLTATNESVTAYNVPSDSTLTIALY